MQPRLKCIAAACISTIGITRASAGVTRAPVPARPEIASVKASDLAAGVNFTPKILRVSLTPSSAQAGEGAFSSFTTQSYTL